MTTRILFSGNRAVGVEYRQGNTTHKALADLEVLVTAGAIGSPKVMMLSGIGPAEHLNSHGIDVVHDLAGVGQNLNDHFGIDIVCELRDPTSLDKYNKLRWIAWAGLQYALFRSGPVVSNVVEGGAFWYADQSQPVQDLQFNFLAGAGVEAGVSAIPSGSGCTLNSYTLRPKSRGSVMLRSNRPEDNPIVDTNFIAATDDLKTSVEGVRISREIMRQKAFEKYVKREHSPGEGVSSQVKLEDYARRYGRMSYNTSGTCKMGSDDMAVVDPQLRVRGLDAIRICDSSIMPSLIGWNTDASTIMIGERASDLLRGNQ